VVLFIVAVAAAGEVGGADSSSGNAPLGTGTESSSGSGAGSPSSAAAEFTSVASTDSPSDVGPDSSSSGSAPWVSTQERVENHEALPCTGPKDPINFEVFSAGPSVGGVPLNSVQRRCSDSAPADEAPANFANYIYGHCEISEGATGCQPPLEIQTWPACQRALGDYSFEGKPLPYRQLPSRGGAKVVEINFTLDNRIEVYTKSSTIVIFANNPALAKEGLAQLRFQEAGEPLATQAEELQGEPEEGLGSPTDGAIKGDLPCQS
jgi:hypothetical protein